MARKIVLGSKFGPPAHRKIFLNQDAMKKIEDFVSQSKSMAAVHKADLGHTMAEASAIRSDVSSVGYKYDLFTKGRLERHGTAFLQLTAAISVLKLAKEKRGQEASIEFLLGRDNVNGSLVAKKFQKAIEEKLVEIHQEQERTRHPFAQLMRLAA